MHDQRGYQVGCGWQRWLRMVGAVGRGHAWAHFPLFCDGDANPLEIEAPPQNAIARKLTAFLALVRHA